MGTVYVDIVLALRVTNDIDSWRHFHLKKCEYLKFTIVGIADEVNLCLES